MKQRVLAILLLLTCTTWQLFAEQWDSSWLKAISVEELDLVTFDDTNIQFFSDMTTLALKARTDITDEAYSLKGEILLMKLADDIGANIKVKKLNPLENDVAALLEIYEAEQLYIYQPKIHDFIKLMHYSCVGMYGHILNRFYDSVFFYPVIFLLVLLFISILSVNFYFKNRKFKLLYNRILIVLVILGLIMTLSFKATCDECIQDDSFYGITFK